MPRTQLILVILLGFAVSMNKCKSEPAKAKSLTENDEPIIGVLSLEVSPKTKKNFPGDHASYIAASYIKFVEGAGARAVPIWIGKPRCYYEDILTKVNGVLLPGGATFFNETGGYADAGREIFHIAMEMNKNGFYLPVWGTCLGFELMTYVAADNREHRTSCDSMGQLLPLHFKNDFKNSRLFAGAPDDIITILETEPVTFNWHMYCTTEKSLAEVGLDKDWSVLSVNQDWNGFDFVSSIEHNEYPFYGIQFHPEKNIYEWASNKNITHTPEAVRISQYFADFLVNECRKNNNKFPTKAEELDTLIYNYIPTFTGKGKSSFVQMYFFGADVPHRICSTSGSFATIISKLLLTVGFFGLWLL